MSQVSSIDSRDGGVSLAADASDGQSAGALGISTAVWIRVSVITALMASLFWPNLHRLWDKTNPFYGEANWGHAICVPIISLYYLYVNREKLLTAPADPWARTISPGFWTWGIFQVAICLMLLWVKAFTPEYLKFAVAGVFGVGAIGLLIAWQARRSALLLSAANTSAAWFGAFILLYGIAVYGYGIYPGQNDFIKDFGMVITLFGVSLMLAGWGRMQIAWFAVAFLICAIPWPGLVYSKVAGPLQQLAANVAVWTLEMTGVESHAGGTKIFIKGYGGVIRTLNVAEACAGLRSLMTFISVGGAVAFLSNRPLWQKLIVTVSAIPIAIFCNVMRVAGQGLLDHYVSQQLSESFAHQFVGMIMLIPAFLLILLIGWVLDQIFLEEVDVKKDWNATVLRRQPKVEPIPASGPLNLQNQTPVPGRSLAALRAVEATKKPKPVATTPGINGRPATVTPPPPSIRLAPGRQVAPKPASTPALQKPLAQKPAVQKPAMPKAPVQKPAAGSPPVLPKPPENLERGAV